MFLSDEDFDKVNTGDCYCAIGMGGDGSLSGKVYKLSDVSSLNNNNVNWKIFKSGKLREEYLVGGSGCMYVKYMNRVCGGLYIERRKYYNYSGELHNEEGAAVEIFNNSGEMYYWNYYLNNEVLTKQQWEDRVRAKLYW